MSDRDRILSKLRQSIDTAYPRRSLRDDPMSGSASARSLHGAIPAAVSEPSGAPREKRFVDLLEGQGATVLSALNPEAVPDLVSDYLASVSSPPLTLRIGTDPLIAGLTWTNCPSLSIERAPATFADHAAMSRAIAGVAEAGACVLASGSENPISLSFMPETHIVLLRRQDIVSRYEEAWERVRTLGPHGLPRSVTLVSGPSRTADIGGRPVLGAHGPKNLLVVLVT